MMVNACTLPWIKKRYPSSRMPPCAKHHCSWPKRRLRRVCYFTDVGGQADIRRMGQNGASDPLLPSSLTSRRHKMEQDGMMSEPRERKCCKPA
jgi:hypothetical protein